MSKIVVSDEYEQLVYEMKNYGLDVLTSDTVKAFHKPEQKHADMQILPICDRIFILQECINLSKKLSNKNLYFCNQKADKLYPYNILLNCLYFGGKLYGKINYIDSAVIEYCQLQGIELINVNQGYTRCSTLAVSENSAITADTSIAKALRHNGADVLQISPGNIVLEGFDYGFIGGCSGHISNNTIAFFGNIQAHPDYYSIKEFILNHNKQIHIFCKDLSLTDIGGVVLID